MTAATRIVESFELDCSGVVRMSRTGDFLQEIIIA